MTKLKEKAEKLDLDDMIHIIDPRADMMLENLRLLALSQGTWNPSSVSASLYESVHTVPEDTLIEQLSKTGQTNQNVQSVLRKVPARKKLITRVIRTFLTEHDAPPTQCTVEVSSQIPISKLFQMDEWSVPAKRVGSFLMAPWSHAAFGKLKCRYRKSRFPLLKEKGSKKWIVAQPLDTMPRRYAWRFETPPSPNPFKTQSIAPKSYKVLFTKALQCLKHKNADCLGALVDIQHFNTRQTTDLLLMLSANARKKGSKNLKASGLASTSVSAVFLWRHFLLWTRYLGVDWAQCKQKVVGVDEKTNLEKRYLSAWTEAPPSQMVAFLKDTISIRTALYGCPKNVELSITGALTKSRKGWVVVDISVSRPSALRSKGTIPPPSSTP